MKLVVKFTAFLVRKTPILSQYRPDWVCDNKPDYNCAQLVFDDIEMINPGESHQCELFPLMTNLWSNVKINDVLKCMEGNRQVGEAVILDIIE